MPVPAEKIIALGEIRTDSERETIAHLRDNLSSECAIVHSVWIPKGTRRFEVDVLVLTRHALYLLDVKNIHGPIELDGSRWRFGWKNEFSPVRTLRMNARELNGILTAANPLLRKVWIDSAVVLTAPNASFHDPTGGETDEVIRLGDAVPFLASRLRVPSGFKQDIRNDHAEILRILGASHQPRPRFRHFGEWEETERLGGDEDVQEYRARHPRSGQIVRVREYRIDPLAPPAERDAQLRRIETAFLALEALRRHPNVPGVRSFFRNEDGDGWILVTDEPEGEVLANRLRDRARPLSFPEQANIIRDVLSALDHAHTQQQQVVHRQIGPDAVLVGERTLVVGFDYARAPRPGGGSIASQIEDRLEGPYVAPECVRAPARATARSDVFSAGMMFFELLVGGRAFETSQQMVQARAMFPHPPSKLRPALPPGIDAWLQDLCAFDSARRPTASEAQRRFEEILAAAPPAPPHTEPATPAADPAAARPPGGDSATLPPYPEEDMSPIESFGTTEARPLPVILLLDRSGSMTQNDKISVLNDAVERMIRHLADDDPGLTAVHLAAITFGNEEAGLHTPFTPAGKVRWTPMSAAGRTPMGAALDRAVTLIEDREIIPSRSYRPALVLVSDGLPTDDWSSALARFRASERASKAHCYALAIGDDADRELLADFAGPGGHLFEAHQAEEIRRFFRFVTMSVTARTRSATPNTVPDLDETDLDALEI